MPSAAYIHACQNSAISLVGLQTTKRLQERAAHMRSRNKHTRVWFLDSDKRNSFSSIEKHPCYTVQRKNAAFLADEHKSREARMRPLMALDCGIISGFVLLKYTWIRDNGRERSAMKGNEPRPTGTCG